MAKASPRKLRIESLENRRLLSGTPGNTYPVSDYAEVGTEINNTNGEVREAVSADHGALDAVFAEIGAEGEGVDQKEDVNDDGKVTPLDALIVVNTINTSGSGEVELGLPPGTQNRRSENKDVNDDGSVTPIDVLVIVNELNARVAQQVPETPVATLQLQHSFLADEDNGIPVHEDYQTRLISFSFVHTGDPVDVTALKVEMDGWENVEAFTTTLQRDYEVTQVLRTTEFDVVDAGDGTLYVRIPVVPHTLDARNSVAIYSVGADTQPGTAGNAIGNVRLIGVESDKPVQIARALSGTPGEAGPFPILQQQLPSSKIVCTDEGALCSVDAPNGLWLFDIHFQTTNVPTGPMQVLIDDVPMGIVSSLDNNSHSWRLDPSWTVWQNVRSGTFTVKIVTPGATLLEDHTFLAFVESSGPMAGEIPDTDFIEG